ncbi:hypothetical protein SAMN05421545_2354 [Pontibacter lucknowensis]|uniref:Uncharacterized protein n=1 Tax=Pontibacter lucknowensis TaxID=1077936 RepID=A0A1N6Y9A4_9BACT|nr:hypothetical protein SAMN05421545_2354 [Pontibacter lucknowensis]
MLDRFGFVCRKYVKSYKSEEFMFELGLRWCSVTKTLLMNRLIFLQHRHTQKAAALVNG